MKTEEDALNDKPLSLASKPNDGRYIVVKADPHPDGEEQSSITLITPGVLSVEGNTLSEVKSEWDKYEKPDEGENSDCTAHKVSRVEHEHITEKLEEYIDRYSADATANDIVINGRT